MRIDFTRIKDDNNGNQRVVCYHDVLLKEHEKCMDYYEAYSVACKRANKIGGHKYDTLGFPGGIAFKTCEIEEIECYILELLKL
jgi:hypothetical protein